MQPEKTHVEIQQHVHLVLDDGDSLEEFLCAHGSHDSIGPAERRKAVHAVCNHDKQQEQADNSSLIFAWKVHFHRHHLQLLTYLVTSLVSCMLLILVKIIMYKNNKTNTINYNNKHLILLRL